MISSDIRHRQISHGLLEVKVGSVNHPTAKTGCTVFRFSKALMGAIDARGGAVAVSDPLSLSLENTWGEANGLVLSGGSTYGLATAVGVKDEILMQKKSTDFISIPSVPAAIVYDFYGRTDLVYPDAELARRGFQTTLEGRVDIGQCGAGRNVTVGKILGREFSESSGQGAHYLEIGEIKILCVSIVNAAGAVLDLSGNVVRGHRDPQTGIRSTSAEILLKQNQQSKTDKVASEILGNTTISVFFTNVRLDRHQLHRLTACVHSAFGRVIEPYSTGGDGDVIFGFTTSELELPKQMSLSQLGSLTAYSMNLAVLSPFSEDANS